MAERSVKVRLTAVVDDFRRQMGEARKATEQVGDAARRSEKETSKFSDAGKAIGKSVGAAATIATTAVAGLGGAAFKAGLDYNTLEQRSRAALTTLLGSTEAANAQMDKLREFGRSSPFPRQVWIEAQNQLIGFGMEAERVIPTLSAIQDTAAATGRTSAADIGEIVNVFAKIQSTGKITARELNQLGIRGIDAAQLLGDAYGKTADQIRADITSGALDGRQALIDLTDQMSVRFAGAAENVKQTWFGAVDRVKGAFRDIGSIIASPFVDPMGGGAAVDWANALADAMRALEGVLGPVTQELASKAGPAFESVTRTLESAAEALKNADIDNATEQLQKFAPAIAGIGAAGLTAGAGALPFFGGLARTLVPGGPLTAGIAAFVLTVPEARDVLSQLVEALAPLVPALTELATSLLPLVTTLVEGLAESLGPVVSAIAAVVDSTVYWIEKLEQFGLMAKQAGDDTKWWEENTFKVSERLVALATGTDNAKESTSKFGRSAQDGAKASGEFAEDAEELTGALANAGAAAEDAKDKLDEYLDLVKRTTDPVYAVVAALDDVESAQAAYNDAVAEYGPKSKEAEDAALKLSQAVDAAEQAAINGDLSFEDFRKRLKSWVEQGVITSAQAEDIERKVERARKESENYKGNYNAHLTITGYDDVRQKLANLESAIMRLPSNKTIRISAEASVGSVGSGAGVFRAQGGPVNGPGTDTSDSIPAWLSDGEYVVKASSVRKYGTDMMDLINAGRFAGGGQIGNLATIKASSNIEPADWKDFAGQAAVATAQNIAKAGMASGQLGKVLPPGSYRIGRGPAAHGYNARDLPAPTGTPIFAAAAGIVNRAARLATSYGIHAAINHGNWRTLYAHMSQMFVRLGQRVGAGQVIGRVGSTGNSTGPHLHLEPDNARLYDRGGVLPHGGAAVNLSGRPELILSPDQTAAMGGRGGPAPSIVKLGTLLGQSFLKAVTTDRAGINALFGAPKPRPTIMEQIGQIDNKKRRAKLSAIARDTRRELMGWAKQLERVNSRLDKARDRLKQLQESARQLRKQTAERVSTTDIAGASRTELNRFGVAFQRTDLASITAHLQRQRNQARQFADVVEKLRKRGLRNAVLQQLIAAGPEQGLSAAQAILGGGKAGIAQVNTLQRQLEYAGNRIGQTAADSMYKAGISAAQGLVKGLEREERRIEKTMVRIASSMVRAIKRQLGIRSPSQVFVDMARDDIAGAMALGLGYGRALVEKSAGELATAAEKNARMDLVAQHTGRWRQAGVGRSPGVGVGAADVRVGLEITGSGALAEMFKASNRKGDIKITVNGARASVS